MNSCYVLQHKWIFKIGILIKRKLDQKKFHLYGILENAEQSNVRKETSGWLSLELQIGKRKREKFPSKEQIS